MITLSSFFFIGTIFEECFANNSKKYIHSNIRSEMFQILIVGKEKAVKSC